MPELPEVQTTVDGINTSVAGKKIIDVWTDLAVAKPTLAHYNTTTKSSAFFKIFKKMVIDAKITKAERRAKNIFIHLSNNNTIWIHMKMTGHMMYGKYAYDPTTKIWSPDTAEKNDALRDPFNKFLHTVFILSNNKHLVLSDVRKFGKVTAFPTAEFNSILTELNLGPEPLTKAFTVALFKEKISKRLLRPIKEILLDQRVVSGIGNIYSDEALWLAGIHPLRMGKNISGSEIKKIHAAVITVLKKGIDFGGDSTSDYRDINGERGKFQGKHEAYRRTGEPCRKRGCVGTIIRIPFSGRGAHFCDTHQK